MSIRSSQDLTEPFVKIGTQANPGAGNNQVIGSFAEGSAKFGCISFLLTTDANAANRYITAELTRAASTVIIGASQVSHVASTAYLYIFEPNCAPTTTIVTPAIYVPVPDQLLWSGNDFITFRINNVQVGDAITLTNWEFLLFTNRPTV